MQSECLSQKGAPESGMSYGYMVFLYVIFPLIFDIIILYRDYFLKKLYISGW